MIFQDPYSSLNPRKTVGTIIGEPFIIHGVETDERKRKGLVQELMEQVGLNPEHYNRLPHQFSGGQRQRIGVARAIALKPKLIVADEPVSRAGRVDPGADPEPAASDLQRDLGLTIIFIAHDLSRRPPHLRPRRGDVPRQDRRAGVVGRALRAPAPPVHGRAAAARSRCRTRAWRATRTARCSAATCPSPANPPSACRFHTRCPKFVEGTCDVVYPDLEVKDGGNLTACHFPLTDEEIARRVPTAAA